MSQTLSVLAMSSPDHEDLIAECYMGDDCLMIVSQERRPNVLDVEVLAGPDGQPRRIEYDVMIELLQRAKARLWDLRKTEGT